MPDEKHYIVKWSIDAEGEGLSPLDAATYARNMQQINRSGHWCGVFRVMDVNSGEKWTVDLDAKPPKVEVLLSSATVRDL